MDSGVTLKRGTIQRTGSWSGSTGANSPGLQQKMKGVLGTEATPAVLHYRVNAGEIPA